MSAVRISKRELKRILGNLYPCERCKLKNPLRCGNQKYCEPCSIIMDDERKKRWQTKQPKGVPTPLTEGQKADRRERETERKRLGIKINDKTKKGISWACEEMVPLETLIRFSIPFNSQISKNAIFSFARGSNYIFVRQKHKDIRQSIEIKIREIMNSNRVRFYEGKIWIDILVQKPMQRVDAINVLDGISDAIKKAIGIDDVWFSIRRLDWEIAKENPQIFVGIGQEVKEHHRICSYCGQTKPMASNFGKRKNDRFGHARVCFECCRIDDKIKRQKKLTRGGEHDTER